VSTKDVCASEKDVSASEIDVSVSEIDVSASEIDVAAHCNCRLAHRNNRPNFFSTETYHQNVEDAPNAYRVAVRNAYCCVRRQRAVRGRNGRRKKHAARTHSRTHADRADDCCTQNIVPSEKRQLGHCAA